jgi:hypothetical protein
MVHTGRRARDGGDQAYHQLHKGGRRRRLQNGGGAVAADFLLSLLVFTFVTF